MAIREILEQINPYLNAIIILAVTIWGAVKFLTSEWIKSKIGIKTHKANLLNEYRLKRYDEIVNEIEKIITKGQEPEIVALNKVYAKMVLSSPDNTLRAFLKATESRIDKKTRNQIYFYLRKELQPKTKLKLEEIEDKLYVKAERDK